MSLELSPEVTDTPDAEDLAFLLERLSAFNDDLVGPSQRRTLALFVRNTSNVIVGGLAGYTAWGWLYVQWLWIDEAWRGQGLAVRMLERAEAEALARGCHCSWIDTFNPDALKAYRKAGYVVFGTLEDFPKGRRRTFLRKKLDG